MRKSTTLELQEIGGDRFPDLETVQLLALSGLAKDLAGSMRELLLAGVLIVQDGRIIVDPKHEEGLHE